MRHAIRFLLAAAVWLLALSQPALGFDEEVTHPALTEESTRRSSLDANLKSETGLDDGIDAFLRGQGSDRLRVFEWLRQGSLLEDVPPCRAGHHFHNPLKPFTTSGVTNQAFIVRLGCSDSGFLPPKSSVTWGTGFVSPTARGPATGNPFDWDAARVAFRDGLTAETPQAREAKLARTFETLGHLLHLVQDLAVPAHVRNDFPAHEAFFPQATLNITRWFQEPFERFVRRNETLIVEAAARAEQVDFVGQLVARFWDTDRYTGANPTADLLQGLAEYTDANFASPNTIFTEDLDPSNEFAFPYPRRSSTNLDLVTSKDDRLVQFVTAEDGREERVLYLAKTGDGELIDRFLKLSFFTGDVLDKAPPGTPAKLLLQIDDEVHRAYAAKLLPRAIGYGAALLDYFFRGRLDFELVAGDGDASHARLVGVNRSEDPLGVGGQLSLYWEDAAGRREPVNGPTLTLSAEVRRNDALPELTFTWPSDPERTPKRFVLAYQGPLGLEAGAVVGKVVESPALEQVYWQAVLVGQQYVFPWFLRTAEDIYVLPFDDFRQFPDEVRWGERDNTLVVQTRQGDDLLTGTSFVVFTLDRPEGSRAVPTTGEVRFGHPVVRLRQGASVALGALAGIDLGTTVTLTHRHVLRQTLFTFDSVTTYRWNETIEGYVFDTVTASGEGVAELAPYDETYQRSFALRLDGAHFRRNCDELSCAFYSWSWEDFTLTAAGDVVLLVRLTEGFLPGTQREVPAWGHVGAGDDPVIIGSLPFSFGFPSDSPSVNELEKVRFLAWVNLTQATVVAKSMADTVTLSQETVFDALREEQRDVTEMTGGPNDGRTVGQWTRVFSSRCTDARETLRVQLERGLRSLGYAGLYRSEFAALALETDFTVTSPTVVTQQCYGAEAHGIGKAYALTAISRELSTFPYGLTTFDFDVKLVLPGTPALERFPLVFTRRSDEERQLVLWNALAGTAQRLLRESAPGFPAMATANQRWALLDDFPRVHLVALDGSGTFDFPWEDQFGRQFVDVYTLVPPDRLYNALDGTFYAVVGPGDLRPTKMPDSLAPVDAADQAWVNAPRWPYHLVRPR